MSLPNGVIWEPRFSNDSSIGGFVTGSASIDPPQNAATEDLDQYGKSMPVKTRSAPDDSLRITPKTTRGAPICAKSALTSDA